MGVDTTSPLKALRPGYARSAKNCYPGLFGGVLKRGGAASQLGSAWTGRSITAGIEFLGASGSKKVVLFGATASATSGKLAYDNSGTMSDIKTSLSESARPSLVQHGNLLFFYNGSDTPFLYDGSGTRQVGITAPTNAPTIATATGGSLTASQTYIWAYTYYNSVTGAESSPSPLSATTSMGTDTKATLTVTAGSSTTADTIRVWRTVASGNILFLDTTDAISATSIVSTKADSALSSTQLELDNTRITTWDSAPEFPLVAQQRVFLKTDRNKVRWSKISQSGPMPESFEAIAEADTTGTYGSADDIVGLAKAGDIPIVLKEQSIGMLEAIGVGQFLQVNDPVTYQYKEIADSVGAVSHWAAVDVFGECIFLARDNIYGTRGQLGDLRPVANSISATIRTLGFSPTQVKRISAINDTNLKQVLFSVFTSTSATEPTFILVGDYQLYPEFRWTFYTQGTDAATHPGWIVGCFFSTTNASSGVKQVMYGNSSLNGQYYLTHSGTADPGTLGIYFELITRPYSMGRSVNTKLFKEGIIYVQGDGSDFSLSVSAIYDLSGEEADETTISLSSGGAVWDTAVWDVSVFASNASPPREYHTHRKASHQQLVFRQSSASAPMTLFNWGTTGSIFRV